MIEMVFSDYAKQRIVFYSSKYAYTMGVAPAYDRSACAPHRAAPAPYLFAHAFRTTSELRVNLERTSSAPVQYLRYCTLTFLRLVLYMYKVTAWPFPIVRCSYSYMYIMTLEHELHVHVHVRVIMITVSWDVQQWVSLVV